MTQHTSHFSTSILLWTRADQPRQTSMDYWRGPHSRIIAATPKLYEYRQIHLAQEQGGLWPGTPQIAHQIPEERRIDGIAEVTFPSALAPLAGRKQTAIAYQDEVNVFRKTIMYAGLPGSSRWYATPAPQEKATSYALIYLRRAPGTRQKQLVRTIRQNLVPAILNHQSVAELREQTFLPWSRKLWDTPNVAHDNPVEERFQASLLVGFTSREERSRFFSTTAQALNSHLTGVVWAVEAYDVQEIVTYVKQGKPVTR